MQPKQIIMAIHTNTFRTLIREGQELLEEVKLYDRPFSFEEHGRYVLVGVRQAGKSYMLYKRAKQLLANGHQLEELVYIDFDDERLLNMKADDFDKILQSYGSVYSHKPVFFFDEIQNVDGWEHFARRLANQKYMVFITGSNAKMLSRDIQTTLGGRYLDSMVFPYSFSEYLEAQGLQIKREWQYGKTKNLVQQHYSQYLRWGGFPELLLYKNKRHWLNDLYEKILLGDIMLRNKVKNEMALRLAIKRLADNILQPTSYNRLANLVKSAGVGTSVASIIDYIKYAKDACLLFTIDNFASKFVDKETIRNAKEDYLYEQKVDEYEDALAVARKEVFTQNDIYGEEIIVKELDDKLSAKIARKLESKGFARGDIFRVLDTLRRESSELK